VTALRVLGFGLSVAALAGCAVGPKYVRPKTPPQAAAPFVSTTAGAATSAPVPAQWWRLYQDPVLDALVQKALTQNADLKTAEANLEYAQALVSEARAGLYPSTELSAGATYGQSSTTDLLASLTGQSAKAGWLYNTGFTAAYQVDLFGRVRRTIQAAKANAQAVADAEDDVRVTVAAETAGAYANACAYAEEAAVARRSVDAAQQTYDIVLAEQKVGAASDLDAARQATVLEQAKAAVPTLDGQRRSALFELAALTGEPPANLSAEAEACQVPPKLSQPLPVGDGAALLKRRPDVREAERQTAAATARIGVAAADLYPTVTLNASFASAASTLAGLTSASAITYGLGPMLSWSFPNILVARAHVKETTAQTSAAIASFDSVVLQALKEAEQTLTTEAEELDRHAALQAAHDRAGEAYALAERQYKAGAISFLDLLTAETTLIQADQQLAVSDQALASDQVAVFQALGGGWEQAPKVVAPPVPNG
jgi:NodT family efflux transporter outer membrane factor (OMF) lipoprotein